jgi:sarcosine oxidase
VHGLKAAVHHGGKLTDPNALGEPDAGLIDAITEWVAQHVVLASPRAVAAETCLYTTTADESFVLERRGRVVIGSACSGHGFKFAPAIGARLASLAMEALDSKPSAMTPP